VSPHPCSNPALSAAANDFDAAEAHLLQTVGIPTLRYLKNREEKRLPERISQLRSAYNLRRAELLQQLARYERLSLKKCLLPRANYGVVKPN
jgi:hypothetical protein